MINTENLNLISIILLQTPVVKFCFICDDKLVFDVLDIIWEGPKSKLVQQVFLVCQLLVHKLNLARTRQLDQVLDVVHVEYFFGA